MIKTEPVSHFKVLALQSQPQDNYFRIEAIIKLIIIPSEAPSLFLIVFLTLECNNVLSQMRKPHSLQRMLFLIFLSCFQP